MTRLTTRQPPELTLKELIDLTAEIRDLQVSRGSVLKIRPPSTSHVISSPITRPVGISLFPTTFSHRCFDRASVVQGIYHELYAAAVRDVDWLKTVLRPLINVDETAALLWEVHEGVQAGHGSIGGIELGIWRGDFMLNVERGDGTLSLKMVEFNTISCAGGAHSDVTTSIHRDLCLSGRSRHHQLAEQFHRRKSSEGVPMDTDRAEVTEAHLRDVNELLPMLDLMPRNSTIRSIAHALTSAYIMFNTCIEADLNLNKPPSVNRCILMIIQPNSLNSADERPVEDALWKMQPVRVPTFRLEMAQVLARTELGQSDELLFRPLLSSFQYEVAVVYFRAGHAITSPDRDGGVSFEARVRIEQSRAIKCPSVLAQMCTFKTVQCALTRPEALCRLLKGDEEKIRAIRETQVRMYTLASSEGQAIAKRILTGEEHTSNWVLKPAAGEGGGHNVFGNDLILALRAAGDSSAYVLMEMIVSPTGITNYLSLGNGQVYGGEVISELGVFGECMFSGSEDFWRSAVAGWSFKSKGVGVNEMSVVKGYGAFDTPFLVDDVVFQR
jgi:glutathione synthetase